MYSKSAIQLERIVKTFLPNFYKKTAVYMLVYMMYLCQYMYINADDDIFSLQVKAYDSNIKYGVKICRLGSWEIVTGIFHLIFEG